MNELSILIQKKLSESNKSTDNIESQIKNINDKLSNLKLKVNIPIKAIKDIDNSIGELLNNKSLNNVKFSEEQNKQNLRDIIKLLVYATPYFIFSSSIKIVSEKLDKIRAISVLSEAGFASDINKDYSLLHSISECEKIKKIKEKNATIKRLVLEYYNTNLLENLLVKWNENPLLINRLPILQSAIKAHIQKDYLLSIPVLLTQVEGIVMDGYYHVGDSVYDRVGVYLKNLVTIKNYKFNLTSEKVYQSLFINTMAANFERGVNEFPESRHAILHGFSYDYGKADYSLKLILFLDMIIELFVYCSINPNSEYHHVGCKMLEGKKLDYTQNSAHTYTNFFIFKKLKNGKEIITYIEKIITFYQSEDEAIRSGKTACPYCIK